MQGISRRQVYKGVAGGSQRKENVASPIMIGRSRNVQTIMCFLQKIPNGTGSVCVLRARSRTERRAAARDQQSGGLLVSPRADSRHLHQARLPLPRRALQKRGACFFAREYMCGNIKKLPRSAVSRRGGEVLCPEGAESNRTARRSARPTVRWTAGVHFFDFMMV